MSGLRASTGEGFLETAVEVRYAETDQMGFAHHACAIPWFELGRVAWMRGQGLPYRQIEARGIRMPVVRVQVRYYAPARFEEQLLIQTRLVELGRARVAFENRIVRPEEKGREGGGGGEGREGRTLLLEGRVDLACVDREGRVMRLPEDIRARFEKLVHRPPGAAEA